MSLQSFSPTVGSSSGSVVSFIAILLILVLAALQALGFFNELEARMENTLRHHLPPHFLPEAPRVVLITLEHSPQGYHAMDVAMVLRGLLNLSPRCIVMCDLIEQEKGPVPFLPTILTKLKAAGIPLIVPQLPSSFAHFQSISLIRFSLTSKHLIWPSLEGRATPGAGDAFLPQNNQLPASDLALPLFATASDGVPIGSLWWWALPQEIHQHPPLLLFGKILLLGNHSALHLTPTGAVRSSPAFLLEMPLDDFLLQIEQKEQGTISPTFDSIWNNTTVILGTHDDAPKAISLAALLQVTPWRHPSLGVQGVIALGWIAVLIIAQRLIISRWLLSTLILLLIIAITILLLHYGIIIPFLPGVITALLLLKRIHNY